MSGVSFPLTPVKAELFIKNYHREKSFFALFGNTKRRRIAEATGGVCLLAYVFFY